MHDVFISYSHKDAQVADAICHRLEAEGIRCWYAPRDIEPGEEWADAIVRALEECRAMVLVFTDFSNSSTQVRREVDAAVNSKKPIIPFKRDETVPSGAMRYYLSTLHWLDAVDAPLEESLNELVARARGLLGKAPAAEGAAAPEAAAPAAAAQGRGKLPVPMIAGAAALALAAAVGIPMLMGSGEKQDAAPTAQETSAETDAPEDGTTAASESSEPKAPAAEVPEVSPAPGDEEAADYYLFTVQYDGTVRLDRYMGPETAELVIPTTIDGARVDSIGEKCFEDAEWIEKLVLPEGLTHIGYRAFYGTTNLKEFNIPASLTSIGGWAFAHSGLTEVVFPETFTSLGYGAFYGCSDLVSVELSEAVDSIGENTFRSGSALSRVVIPNAEPEIAAKAFEPDTDVTIVGVPGSYTEKYAKGMGLAFEAYGG